jgi:DNA polymerase III delta prime subunit
MHPREKVYELVALQQLKGEPVSDDLVQEAARLGIVIDQPTKEKPSDQGVSKDGKQ